MISPRAVSWCLLAAAVAAGTLSDRPHTAPPLAIGGYRVLAADFHVHNFPLSASTLAPWDLVLEARRQGLDALAITPHNHVLGGKIGRWFSRAIGGPVVLAGEEIHAPRYHMIAAGIHSTISWRMSAPDAIDEVHRQGGVAIAAHPSEDVWGSFAPAMGKLDGTEVAQPVVYTSSYATEQLQHFYRLAPLAAIGSSDYHGPGPLGLCRTYVFVKEVSEAGVLEAVRSHRTVVFDRGRVYGDPALIRLAGAQLPRQESISAAEKSLAALSRICAILGLLGIVAAGHASKAYRDLSPALQSRVGAGS